MHHGDDNLIGWGFLCKHIYIYITHPRSVQETPSPCTSSDSTGGSGLEGGRILGFTLYESAAGSRVVHDRVRGYTYSFHPAGVVHMYPLGLQAGS